MKLSFNSSSVEKNFSFGQNELECNLQFQGSHKIAERIFFHQINLVNIFMDENYFFWAYTCCVSEERNGEAKKRCHFFHHFLPHSRFFSFRDKKKRCSNLKMTPQSFFFLQSYSQFSPKERWTPRKNGIFILQGSCLSLLKVYTVTPL